MNTPKQNKKMSIVYERIRRSLGSCIEFSAYMHFFEPQWTQTLIQSYIFSSLSWVENLDQREQEAAGQEGKKKKEIDQPNERMKERQRNWSKTKDQSKNEKENREQEPEIKK